MKKITVVLLVLFFVTGVLLPQEIEKNELLKLSPYPVKVVHRPGSIYLRGEVTIAAAANSTDDFFAARQLVVELRNRVGGNPVIKGENGEAVVLLTRCAADSLGKEGYILDVRPNEIEILAGTGAGMFYGVQTLRQLIRANLNPDSSLNCLHIVDIPALTYRGWQDDISRGPIPTLDYLKRQVRTLSEYKLNCMTLYTEHVFKLEKHPVISPEDGITADEIQELIEYAADYHVEVIGNFQSFGHFAHILKHPEYTHLAETRNVLSPAFEESYEFLADVYEEIAPVYVSPLFNINCDETFGLGTGPARTMLDSIGKEGVYAYHINRINELLKPHGKRMMMWGDIARDYPDIIPKLPKDLIVLPWGYHAAESFESDILPFTTMGFEFIVCPGVSCWRQIYPDFQTAVKNISNFVRDGVRHGAMGMLNTTWDDDGENLANYHWYPLIWGAEVSWNPIIPSDLSQTNDARNARLAAFNRAFDPLFFNTDGDTFVRLMNQLSRLRRKQGSGGLNNSSFWKSLIDIKQKTDPAADDLFREVSAIAAELSALAGLARQNRDVAESAAFAASRVRLMAEKTELGREISKRGTVIDEFDIRQRIAKIGNKVGELQKEYERLWNLENRPWWLNVNIEKYRKLQQEIINTPEHVSIQPDVNTFSRRRRVNLKTFFPSDEIYYTINGREPDENSKWFSGPFFIDESSVVKARIRKNGKLGPISEQNVFVYTGIVYKIKSKYKFAPQYSAGGMIGLVDGVHGSDFFREGNYQGYAKNDFDVVLDLGKVRDLFSIETGFLQDTRSWILFPEWLEYSISFDGEFYGQVARIENKVDPAIEGGMRQLFKADLTGRRAKYIRIQAKNMGLLPDWHKSAGGEAWLFVDEVEIK